MKRLAQLTKEAGLQGKVAISHAFGLGDVSRSEAEEMADILYRSEGTNASPRL